MSEPNYETILNFGTIQERENVIDKDIPIE